MFFKIKKFTTIFFKFFSNELFQVTSTLISIYPDTIIGIRLRNWWFGRQFKSKKLVINIMQGFKVTSPESIVVGNRFSVNINNYLNAGGQGCHGIYFGDNVALGPNVYIRTVNHKYGTNKKDIRDQGHLEKKRLYRSHYYSVIFEGNNWVGANCIILPGSLIKKGAIIGAGSIISGIIKENSVYLTTNTKLAFLRNK